MSSFYYGLDRASHDFSDPKSLGKNIFTNAAPLSLIQFMDQELDLNPNVIRATINDNGEINTELAEMPWSEVIGVNPSEAYFDFEKIYDGYRPLTNSGEPNKSDAVVVDREGNHKSAFEIKLTVVPNATTANKPREDQGFELVTRPSTIEQLAFSIARSFGENRRHELNEIIVDRLRSPGNFTWNNEEFMIPKLSIIHHTMIDIIKAGLVSQTPLVINAVWRTVGQSPFLDDECFDIFIWTDLAFVQLFTSSVEARSIRRSRAIRISRPQRALIWLVKMLFDYSSQKTLSGDVMNQMSYGAQTDKAASFQPGDTLKFLRSHQFLHPRVRASQITDILSEESFEQLKPERRLDASIVLQNLLESKSAKNVETLSNPLPSE